MFWIVLRYLLVSSPRLPGGDVSVEVIMIGFLLVDASIMSMRQTRIIRHRHPSLNFHVPFPSLAPVLPPTLNAPRLSMRPQVPITRTIHLLRHFTMSSPAQAPKINRISPLAADEAKWTELRKIEVINA